MKKVHYERFHVCDNRRSMLDLDTVNGQNLKLQTPLIFRNCYLWVPSILPNTHRKKKNLT